MAGKKMKEERGEKLAEKEARQRMSTIWFLGKAEYAGAAVIEVMAAVSGAATGVRSFCMWSRDIGDADNGMVLLITAYLLMYSRQLLR
jgi:hypothetical protein